MKKEYHFVNQLVLRLLLFVIFFSIARICFYSFNKPNFPTTNLGEIILMYIYGIRFDLSAIFITNIVLILTYLIPFSFRHLTWYKVVQKILFFIVFIFDIGAELTDVAYFKFNQRRSLISDLLLLKNTAAMIPNFLKEYWYLLFLGIFIFLFINVLYNKMTLVDNEKKQTPKWQIIIFLMSIPFVILIMRGGSQLRPLTPIDAAKYVPESRFTPLVSNTTLNFLTSYQSRTLTELNHFSPSELDAEFSLNRKIKSDSAFRPMNVVVIALESFGKEYMTHYNDYQGFTPFLDSLVDQSLTCKYSFANAQRSASGIVAITAGIPQLMEDPLMFSPYMTNHIDGLAALLRKKGYETGFFHGCNPGSMEFEEFAHLSGFQHFYDRTAYPNQADYDGQWGIWDRPFLEFFADNLNQYKQPFFGFTFTLTSHHPFNVEAYYEKMYPNEDKFQRSFRYTDDALKNFFAKASKMPWFDNTLFVLCADHIGLIDPKHGKYYNQNGRFQIPILFYCPKGKLKGEQDQVAQHIDILPSVLDYLHYDLPFTAFGESVFNDDNEHYTYTYSDNVYQISNGKFSLLYDGNLINDLYDLKKDPDMLLNAAKENPALYQRMLKRLKAVIQRHHQAMIRNELTIKK